MAKLWLIQFTVKAKTKLLRQFPLDMLRYDGCTIHDFDSISHIMDSFDTDLRTIDFESEPIVLDHYEHGNKNWEPTYRRWQSYGYEVIDVQSAKDGY